MEFSAPNNTSNRTIIWGSDAFMKGTIIRLSLDKRDQWVATVCTTVSQGAEGAERTFHTVIKASQLPATLEFPRCNDACPCPNTLPHPSPKYGMSKRLPKVPIAGHLGIPKVSDHRPPWEFPRCNTTLSGFVARQLCSFKFAVGNGGLDERDRFISAFSADIRKRHEVMRISF